ncbi:MAG: hypothetical protein HY744_03480 [Deltaproteobacteria bacterium]|nr:hypothetical protein [Deltaproteobacteria bacterium]
MHGGELRDQAAQQRLGLLGMAFGHETFGVAQQLGQAHGLQLGALLSGGFIGRHLLPLARQRLRPQPRPVNDRAGHGSAM